MPTSVNRKDLPDLQNQKDTRGKHIERVGIEDVKIPLAISRKNKDGIPSTVEATVAMYVSIDHAIKGANMCYDDQTEILTQNGWKFFKNLHESDKVATLDKSNQKFKWQTPTNYFNGAYKGKMFNIECRGINICVTPNHNLLLQDSNKKTLSLMRADEFFDKTKYRMTKECTWVGHSPDFIEIKTIKTPYTKNSVYRFPTLDFMKLLGFYLAEGCSSKDPSRAGGYNVIWSNYDKTILNGLAGILNKQNINTFLSKNGAGFNLSVSNKSLYDYFSKLKKSSERFIPTDIKNLTVPHLQVLFNYYLLGDGNHTNTHKSKVFYTASKRLADDFQEVGLKCKYGVHIKDKKSGLGSFKPGTTQYTGYLSNNLTPTINTGRDPSIKNRNKWIDYTGKIYCCSVPNGILMVRRKGIPIWSGNSRFLECLMSYESELITSARVEDMVNDMLQRLDSKDGYIEIKFNYFIPKLAPVSKTKGVQCYEVKFIGRSVEGKYDFAAEVNVIGTNLCPCSFTGDDILFLENDVITFKDLEEGETTFHGSEITKVYKYKNNKPSYSFKTVGTLPLLLTEGHKVLITDGVDSTKTWETVENIENILKSSEDPKYTVLPKYPIDDSLWDNSLPSINLSPGLSTHHMIKSSKVQFTLNIAPEDAFVLGVLFTEGTFSEKGHTFAFSLNINESLLKYKIVKVLQSWGCTNVKIRTYPDKNTQSIEVSNIVIGSVLREIFNGLSKNRRIPKCIMMSKNKEIIKQFILGWYEGDGTHNTTRKLHPINTVSKIAAMQLQLLGLKLDNVLSISKAVNNNHMARKVVDVLPLYRITLSQKFLYEVGLLKDDPEHKNYTILEDKDNYYLKITQVQNTGEIPDIVYDATTENAQLTAPFIVHNSKEISEYGAHNQRNHIRVRLTLGNSKGGLYWIEDIIDQVEGCLSCPIFPVLKREDEKWVTEKAYENPKFVEDLARDVALMLDSHGIAHYHIRSKADESIHHHEAVAYLNKNWIFS